MTEKNCPRDLAAWLDYLEALHPRGEGARDVPHLAKPQAEADKTRITIRGVEAEIFMTAGVLKK